MERCSERSDKCTEAYKSKGLCVYHYNKQWNKNHWRTSDYGRTYNVWYSMNYRCTKPNSPNWKYYGSRGITVTPEWQGKTGLAQFIADMGYAPLGLSIERRDNELGYSKSNCYWATWKEQRRNRRPYDTSTLKT